MSEILPLRAPARKPGAVDAHAHEAPARSAGARGRTPRARAKDTAKKAGSAAPLGIYGDDVQELTPVAAAAFDPMELRALRFALQSVARRVLHATTERRFAIATCLRARAHKQQIGVWKAEEFKTAHYSGLQTCGSASACPVCAAKIGERRRSEVLSAMAVHDARGGNVHMLTLTAPHQRGDLLDDLLAKWSKATNRFWKDPKVIAVLAEMGYIRNGYIRAWEVTHGRKAARNNGWHPHLHILLFTGMGVDLARFDDAQRRDWASRLYLVWAKACEFAGLGTPSFEHGLKLDDGTKASAYITKWGLEDELTKGYSKKGRDGNETPFDFLRALLENPDDKQAAALFLEFAETVRRRKVPFLRWGNGLKALLAVEEVSDEEIATRVDEEAVLLGLLSLEHWRNVLAADARAAVLQIAARLPWPDVCRFLDLIDGAADAAWERDRERVQLFRDCAADALASMLAASAVTNEQTNEL